MRNPLGLKSEIRGEGLNVPRFSAPEKSAKDVDHRFIVGAEGCFMQQKIRLLQPLLVS